MALINFVKKKDATGQVAEIYKAMEEKINILPNVLQFHTASQELYPKLMNVFNHFINHENFSPQMLAYTRMLISFHAKGEYCLRFQTSVLKHLGETDKDIKKAQADYHLVNLDKNKKALVVFVLDLMTDKEIDKKEKITTLRKLGWTDKDIYELSFVGGLQRGMLQVIKGFDLEIDF